MAAKSVPGKFPPRQHFRATPLLVAALLGVGGVFAAGGLGRPQRAAAALHVTSPRRITAERIRHIVLIMQENHSFDNVLGKFCTEVAARQIVRPGYDSACDGATSGELSSGISVALSAAPDVVPDSNHTVAAQTADIAGLHMNGFDSPRGSCPQDYRKCYNQYNPLAGTCTSGVNPNATCIPYLGALATRYTVAEDVFELADAPSWGGHLYAAAATLDGFRGDNPVENTFGFPIGPGWGCDSGRVDLWGSRPATKVPSCVPGPTGGLGPLWKGYTGPKAAYVPTIFDRLDAAKLSWRLYAGAGSPDGGDVDSGWQWAICPSFAECLDGPQRTHVVPATQIISDAGDLPAFSIVTPLPTNSQHNGDSMLAGDNWINQIVSAIQASPDWSSTVIFITYDDCGCQYDHVPPPNGWGVRVPMVIVSPYAKLGYSDGAPTTIAGVLGFAEHVFRLSPLNSTDGSAYDFSGSFCFRGPPQCTPAGLAPVKLPRRRLNPLTPAQLATQRHDNLQAS